MEAEDAKDPSPWYVKGYPYFTRGELRRRLKFIIKTGSLLEGHERELQNVAAYWRRILARDVRRDLKDKFIVFEYEDYPDPETYGKVVGIKDAKGEWIPSSDQFGALESGRWFMATIELFSESWSGYNIKEIEEIILHELCHLVYPKMGFVIKAGTLYEDEAANHKFVMRLIKKYGSALDS